MKDLLFAMFWASLLHLMPGKGEVRFFHHGELPVTSEEFGACAFDIGVLKNAYLGMCSR